MNNAKPKNARRRPEGVVQNGSTSGSTTMPYSRFMHSAMSAMRSLYARTEVHVKTIKTITPMNQTTFLFWTFSPPSVKSYAYGNSWGCRLRAQHSILLLYLSRNRLSFIQAFSRGASASLNSLFGWWNRISGTLFQHFLRVVML